MTSDFTVPSHTGLPHTNNYIVEINNIFYQHWLTLDKKRQTEIDNINQWCLKWKKYIKKHADEQKVLLNNNYDRLRHVFDRKHKENLETANAYHAAQQLELFNELRDACQVLQFQVARLEYCNEKMEYPKVIDIEEQEEIIQLEQTDTNTRENARRRRRHCKDNDKKTEHTSSASASPSCTSITSYSKQTNNRRTFETQSKREDDHLTSTKDASIKQVKNDDDSNDKCPICFMIFSSNMTRSNRHRHVNEHMIGDHDN
ncbi:unnamed protein product [Rotaria sordida]|uniref:Uncharacterized protein n=1 Tax=Rotaria sordida TaxID=392033 RepID=A0A814V604_9BILA|nr:unnamed protein product [Rotaria sordida]